MYHIMVYSSEAKGEYYYPYAVHFFTETKLQPAQAFEKASEIIAKHFGTTTAQCRYVGYEGLPLSVPEFYVVVKFDSGFIDDFAVAPSVPREAENIVSHRFSRLTVDIDRIEYMANALDGVRKLQLPFTVFKTARGYHIRADLPKVLDFSSLIKLREECHDDLQRMEIDKEYHKKGLDFLTNFLFNEKAWIEEEEIKSYREREVSLREIIIVRDGRALIKLPKFHIPIGEISIDLDEYTVTARGPADVLTKEYFDLIMQGIEDNFWEYSLRREQEEDAKTKIVNAYAKISPKAMFVASKCDVEVNYSIVTLKVPPELSDYIGILIGKEGKNIKAVQEETGLKVVIARPTETEKPKTEEEEMKEKLQEMLKSLV